jgi:hypothetical protein
MREHTAAVLEEVHAERRRQDSIWGEQNHPDACGHGDVELVAHELEAREVNRKLKAEGKMSWAAILGEEAAEVFDEVNVDDESLRAELVQMAAVAVAWIECIDRRREPQ